MSANRTLPKTAKAAAALSRQNVILTHLGLSPPTSVARAHERHHDANKIKLFTSYLKPRGAIMLSSANADLFCRSSPAGRFEPLNDHPDTGASRGPWAALLLWSLRSTHLACTTPFSCRQRIRSVVSSPRYSEFRNFSSGVEKHFSLALKRFFRVRGLSSCMVRRRCRHGIAISYSKFGNHMLFEPCDELDVICVQTYRLPSTSTPNSSGSPAWTVPMPFSTLRARRSRSLVSL